MLLSFFKSRPTLEVILAITLTTGWLHAAPNGPNGLETEWTQPAGLKIFLRDFVNGFHDCTVVFNPATNSYQYDQPGTSAL